MVAIGVSLATLLSIAVSRTWFALDGWAHVLYWLHDHVVLYAIGHLWTRFFPYSLVWCVLLAAWLGLLLVSFCTPNAILQPLHIRVTRFVVQRRLPSRLIGSWCRHVGTRSWGWQQIASIVEFECDVVLDRAVRFGPGYGIDRALRVIRLYAEISLALRHPQRHGTGALEALYELVALLLIIQGRDLRHIPDAHRDLFSLLLDRAAQSEQTPPCIEMIRALINTREYLSKDSALVIELVQEVSDFIAGLDRRVIELERQRRTRARRLRETDRLTETSIRLRLMHALVVSKLAEAFWPAEAVLLRLESYLLLQTLSAGPVADACIRSRDFAYLRRLMELHGKDEAAAIESVRTLDGEVLSAQDLKTLQSRSDVLERAAGFAERTGV